MTHMNVFDRLQVLNAYYLANHFRIENLFKFPEIAGVSQHMANSNDAFYFFCLREYLPAFFFGGRNWFLEQYIITPVQGLHTRCAVQVIGCCNDNGIGKFFFLKYFFPGSEAISGMDFMETGHSFQSIFVGISYCNDFHFRGTFPGEVCINASAMTSAYQYHA